MCLGLVRHVSQLGETPVSPSSIPGSNTDDLEFVTRKNNLNYQKLLKKDIMRLTIAICIMTPVPHCASYSEGVVSAQP